VIAHRRGDDETEYSVYAHLALGSVGVKAGTVVCAGDPLGRVGRTGRASTPHLHFEVRRPRTPEERWEKASVVDPVAFVLARLPDQRFDTSAARPYVEWAESEGLILAGADGERALTRAAWWRMLAAAVKRGPGRGGQSAETLRDSLLVLGLLPDESAKAAGDGHVPWSELARDAGRLRRLGVRTPHGPLAKAAHRECCWVRFGEREPGEHAAALRHREGEPTAADACVLLADLSGPLPVAHLHRARHAHGRPGPARKPQPRAGSSVAARRAAPGT